MRHTAPRLLRETREHVQRWITRYYLVRIQDAGGVTDSLGRYWLYGFSARALARLEGPLRQLHIAGYIVAGQRPIQACFVLDPGFDPETTEFVALGFGHWACPGFVDGYGLGFQALCGSCLLS